MRPEYLKNFFLTDPFRDSEICSTRRFRRYSAFQYRCSRWLGRIGTDFARYGDGRGLLRGQWHRDRCLAVRVRNELGRQGFRLVLLLPPHAINGALRRGAYSGDLKNRRTLGSAHRESSGRKLHPWVSLFGPVRAGELDGAQVGGGDYALQNFVGRCPLSRGRAAPFHRNDATFQLLNG